MRRANPVSDRRTATPQAQAGVGMAFRAWQHWHRSHTGSLSLSAIPQVRVGTYPGTRVPGYSKQWVFLNATAVLIPSHPMMISADSGSRTICAPRPREHSVGFPTAVGIPTVTVGTDRNVTAQLY
eukprot:485718-Rhodomonas_salina.1